MTYKGLILPIVDGTSLSDETLMDFHSSICTVDHKFINDLEYNQDIDKFLPLHLVEWLPEVKILIRSRVGVTIEV